MTVEPATWDMERMHVICKKVRNYHLPVQSHDPKIRPQLNSVAPVCTCVTRHRALLCTRQLLVNENVPLLVLVGFGRMVHPCQQRSVFTADRNIPHLVKHVIWHPGRWGSAFRAIVVPTTPLKIDQN